MSKRKRRRPAKPTETSSRTVKNKRRSTKDSPATPTEPKPKKSQKGLLALALVVLAGVAVLNFLRQRQDKLPSPIILPAEAMTAVPLTATEDVSGTPLFTALTPAQTGIDFVHPVQSDHPLSYLYYSGTAAGGIAVGDIDNDGRLDIYVVSGPGKNRLYRQTETAFVFEDITDSAGVDGGEAWGCGPTMVDINADGRLDIFVANYDSPNSLYINRGDGSFVEQAREFGLNMTDASMEGVFADYDLDGDLDLYLLTYRYENPDGMPAVPPILEQDGHKYIRPGLEKYYAISNDAIGYTTVGRSDGLLRNNNGKFEDASRKAGIHGRHHGQSATWWDYNNDGLPDLYVANDFNDSDHLYKNNGDGSFSDVIREAVPHTAWFSMGTDAGDLDGDGKLDLLTSDMSSTTHFKQKTTMGSMSQNRKFLETAVPRQYMRNALLMNTGTDRFEEAAYLTGLDSTDWTWAVKIIDLDCDGLQDVFVTNGSVRTFTDSDRTTSLAERAGRTEWDIHKDSLPLREQNLAFRNRGSMVFEDASKKWGLDYLGVSMSAAHADFDNDGDPDLIVSNVDEPLLIYKNNATSTARLSVSLRGRMGNRLAVGSRVTLKTDGHTQVQEVFPSRGFLASNDATLHFGLSPEVTHVESLTIRWPQGHETIQTDLAVGMRYTFTEPVAAGEKPPSHATTPEYREQALPGALAHRENEFDDYALQSLLPFRMSQLGPSAAVADIDQDGDFDLFLGGAAGQPGRIARRNKEQFELDEQPALEADKATEDMGAVWFDLENDGDVDLFVLSGGNEVGLDSELLTPRLYLNDGAGRLTRANGVLPELRASGGPVAAADFDKDGDVDLFVGGRQIPGKYPLPAASYLLMNEGGTLVDKTADLATGWSELGMVTGALWTDVDNDGSLDLMVTTEWGLIHQFRFEHGKFVDYTSATGLQSYRGWWTGIVGADFDSDGDIDYVATNLGLNTKYHASDERPFQIYYGDFENNGRPQLVEAEYENDTLFPVRGKSCSTHAMPMLEDKFPTYKDFALASLQDIYTPQSLDDSYKCSANLLATSLLINDGKGNFKVVPLPSSAQLSPSFGAVATEFTGDGIPDLFLAQNFYSPQPETGNMDGSLGVLLRGKGDGTFDRISPETSGISLPQDATAALAMDLNLDGAADLLVATNNGPPRAWVKQSLPHTYGRAVTFSGVSSTSAIAGTRITAQHGDTPPQTYEFHAGSGYLTQQGPTIFIGARGAEGDWQITVHGNGGKETSHRFPHDQILLEVPRPE